jgi:hypothetical protein
MDFVSIKKITQSEGQGTPPTNATIIAEVTTGVTLSSHRDVYPLSQMNGCHGDMHLDKGPKIASTRHRDNPLLQIRQDRLGNKRCDKQSHCVVCGDNHHVKEHWIASTGLGPPDFTHVKGGLCGGCDSRELETLSGCDPITHPIVNHPCTQTILCIPT